jgi:hypothetical protein
MKFLRLLLKATTLLFGHIQALVTQLPRQFYKDVFSKLGDRFVIYCLAVNLGWDQAFSELL